MRPQFLLKFGQPDHMQALFEEGLLYCETLEFFSNLEEDDEDGTGDPWEGTMEVYDRTQVTISAVTMQDGVEVQSVPLELEPGGKVWHRTDGRQNIYCFYGVLDARSTYVDPRNYKGKPICVLIHDVPEFFRRLQRAIAKKPDNMKEILHRHVEYREEFHTGTMGPFRKRTKFAHQSEYRLLILPGDGAAKRIVLGSLKDIAEIGEGRLVSDAFRLEENLLPPKRC